MEFTLNMEFPFKYVISLYIWHLPLNREFTFKLGIYLLQNWNLPLNMEFTFKYGIYL